MQKNHSQFTPFLMFERRAEEALNCHISSFEPDKLHILKCHRPGAGAEGTAFLVNGQAFKCNDSLIQGKFSFPSALSFKMFPAVHSTERGES